jgi:hypothetical protein
VRPFVLAALFTRGGGVKAQKRGNSYDFQGVMQVTQVTQVTQVMQVQVHVGLMTNTDSSNIS